MFRIVSALRLFRPDINYVKALFQKMTTNYLTEFDGSVVTR